jgi:hypothetical protein
VLAHQNLGQFAVMASTAIKLAGGVSVARGGRKAFRAGLGGA